MTDARTEGGEGQQTGEAVAEIGPGWQLLWYSRDTMVNIIARTGLKTGDLLYRHPPANPASREALARIAELEAELERANNWNEQVTGFGLDRLDELADAWIERTEITRLFSAVSSVFAKWANDDIIDRFKQAQADLAHLSYVEGAISGANIALALQPARRESELRASALEEAARLVDRRIGQRFAEYGTTEPDTNSSYYQGRAAETHEALDEEDEAIAIAIRALARHPEAEGEGA